MRTEKRKIYEKEYYQKNKEKIAARYRENREAKLKKVKEYEARNKEKIALRKKKWQQDNREEISLRKKRYTRENLGLFRSHNARRRASKLQATPEWSERELIKVVYEKAKWLESLTGLKYHVDHIIPLKGKNVCGLHCWQNLQILEASLNISKGSFYEV